MAGLAQYSEYFENPLFTEIINEVPVETGYKGSRFLPRDETYEIEFNETILERQQDMADIVDSGAELPLTDRDPMRRVSGAITDIGQSYIVTKKELGALMDKGNPGKRKVAERQLLGKAKLVKANIDARLEWLIWQALGEGAITYNKAGIKLASDFGVDAIEAAVTKWDGVTPTIIADYEGWVQDYVDRNGVYPDVYMTSITVIRAVLNDETVRKQITGLADKLVTLQELNDFLRGRQMPPMEAFDASVAYRDVDNGGVRVQSRLLNAKKGVFLKEGGAIGQLLIGPTVENNMEPGIFGRTFTMERPKREIVEVVAASWPKVTDPDLITITTVLT